MGIQLESKLVPRCFLNYIYYIHFIHSMTAITAIDLSQDVSLENLLFVYAKSGADPSTSLIRNFKLWLYSPVCV